MRPQRLDRYELSLDRYELWLDCHYRDTAHSVTKWTTTTSTSTSSSTSSSSSSSCSMYLCAIAHERNHLRLSPSLFLSLFSTLPPPTGPPPLLIIHYRLYM